MNIPILVIHTKGVYNGYMNTQRINITLSKETLNKMKENVKEGERSSFISRAINFYIKEMGKKNLREQLKEEGIARSKEKKQIADEWFLLEENL